MSTGPKPVIVFGSRNRKKWTEVQSLLADMLMELRALIDDPTIVDVDETGDSFEANACMKATGFAGQTGCAVLAEDSGLVVPALNNAPGIFSARYAGDHGNDAANNAKLCMALKNIPEAKRDAYYICVAALADATGKILAVAEGRCWGRIVLEPRGPGNFGYDPHFLVPEMGRTFGELSLRVKHALSHRARALERLRPAFFRLLSTHS
jgi:XTP/dITP diphosphohydrolase